VRLMKVCSVSSVTTVVFPSLAFVLGKHLEPLVCFLSTFCILWKMTGALFLPPNENPVQPVLLGLHEYLHCCNGTEVVACADGSTFSITVSSPLDGQLRFVSYQQLVRPTVLRSMALALQLIQHGQTDHERILVA
jgi:hypothetical protein